ncbi:serine/threonine-protein kinase ppk11, partial [Nadsonia fulvescens var. elongata DSM 6958]
MNDSSDSIFDYESSGLIGQGSFGKVYRAHHKRTGKLVAVKALPMNRTDRDRHAVLKEITILEQLKRSNYVAKYLAHYEYNNIIFIVMEYCSGGSCEIVSHLHGGLSESCIAIICRDVLRGIVELHSQGIVHRDIKGANIVLTAQGQAKLTDFGVASRATVNCDVAGTPFWMPPEMLKGRELDTLTTTLGIPHGSEVDIWSLGITVLELAHARAPLMNHALRNAMVMIPEIDPPHVSPEAGFSIEFKAFVAACLKVDPKKRATASELLQMKFIKQVSGKRDLRKLV